MKKVNILLATFLGLMMFACEDDHDLRVAPQDEIVAPVLKSVLPQNLVITESTPLENPVGAIYWNEAEYAVDKLPSKYTVEIDKAGNNFASPTALETLQGYTFTTGITGKKLNDFAKGFFTVPGSYPFSIEIRIKAGLADEKLVKPVYSNVILFSYTAFVSELPTKDPLYIVGNLISGIPEWSNSADAIGNGLQVFFADDSKADNKKYTYTGLFAGGKNFKLPITAGNWDTGYAWDGGKLGANNVGSDIPGPGTDGYYTMTADLSTLALTFTPYTAGAAAVRHPFVALIGEGSPSGNWDTNTNMVEVTPHIWVLSAADMKVGEFKFRNSTDWSGTAWGAESATYDSPYGVASDASDAKNFKIEKAGIYLIQFNDLTKHYVIILKSKLP